MPHPSYLGRHRPASAASPSRVRKIVVPLVLIATTAAGGLAIRTAGAAELSPGLVSAQGAAGAGGVGADARALVAARTGGADAARISRDSDRAAVATLTSGSADVATAASTAARAAAETAAKEAAAAKAAAKKAAEAAALAKARRWVAPLAGYSLTSGYGMRWGKMHAAQDLATSVGTPVRALSSGTVVSAGWDSTGYGRLLKIRYWDGTVSWMAHNSRIDVSAGATVSPGQVVARSGNSGHSTGPHVHLEIHPGAGKPVAPMTWLAARGVRL
ncbi:MAG: M23 family metallopeptidase [Terracoccus sp.]